jgi:hypothetical protein
MTDTQKIKIQALAEGTADFDVVYKNTDNPFAKAVYESFLKMNDNAVELQQPVLLDIIRASYIILRQEVILKSPIKLSVEAYINVHNILYDGEFELLHYFPHHFHKDDIDEDDKDLFWNETICIGKDGLYYLCSKECEPRDKGYYSLEELANVHGSAKYLSKL